MGDIGRMPDGGEQVANVPQWRAVRLKLLLFVYFIKYIPIARNEGTGATLEHRFATCELFIWAYNFRMSRYTR